MSLISGDKLGQYEIIGPIGAGGMGEVFRARDPRLGRDIAIKVLPAAMAQDPDRLARFQREARAVAALNHPHIVTIYSVEHAGDIHFLTMELVEGKPLDRVIRASGLPVEQIVDIAGALADALAAAHDKGIVHRDLKPANVMISSEGRVKVLDFGLAKDVSDADPKDATRASFGNTQAGMVMGTPAYMSPEQISARPLDHRTDIFSLGVVLHEMATGRQPFVGSSSAELISSILRDTPQSAAELRPDLPSDLARIIRRCLEKDPRHRIQTARDVSNEFRDLTRHPTQRPPVPIPAQPPAPASAQSLASHSRITSADSGAARADEGFWVAVLPFKAQGSSPDLAALAEGLTEDIVTGMSRFSYLRVVARSASSRFTNQTVEASSAAKELGARYIMEGTVRQAGNKVRIAAQLVDATSGAHLWAETYVHEFSPDAPFELQDELVPRIVSTVADPRGVLAHSMGELLRSRPQDALTPYEAVLRSFAYLQRISLEEHALARTALERAVEKAPGHCDAWAMLAIMYREEFAQGFNLLHDPLPRASAAAHRAIEIGPSNHLAQHALASVLFFRGEYEAFRIAADRAVALNPMDGFNVAYMGSYIANAGDLERGCALVERARALNPNFPGWYWLPSVLKAYRHEDYRTALGFALKVNMPTLWRSNVLLAAVYGQLGEWEKSQKALQCLETVRPGFAAAARIELEKFFQPDLAEHVIDGLRKAGMTIAPTLGETATARLSRAISAAPHASGTTRADEGFWVAVLPFKAHVASPELAALADGLSGEIVTGFRASLICESSHAAPL